jgi:hypothetical protein
MDPETCSDGVGGDVLIEMRVAEAVGVDVGFAWDGYSEPEGARLMALAAGAQSVMA